MVDVLDALAELERRYDGPIPEPLRRNFRVFAESRLLIDARGQADLFGALIRSQIEAIRRARRAGIVPGRLLADLKLYRRQEFCWRQEARRLDAAIMPTADDAP